VSADEASLETDHDGECSGQRDEHQREGTWRSTRKPGLQSTHTAILRLRRIGGTPQTGSPERDPRPILSSGGGAAA
jgi:hypothetical protein